MSKISVSDREREDGVSSERVHRRQRQRLPLQERRGVGGGEADAVEAAVHVEEKRGAAEAGRGEVVPVRPAELLPELRRRPQLAFSGGGRRL